MNRPMKMLGMAAGMATRRTRYGSLAPSVRATSRYEARVFEIPEAVSIVTGNQTARAMMPMAENLGEGDRTIASGIHAVAGIGPTTFNSGMPQYRAWLNQPIQTPVTKATATPSAYPARRSLREFQALSNKRARSSIRLCSTPAGPGKYGNGNNRNPEVITSQKHASETAAAIIVPMCRIHRRRCDEN